ncbi:hypothetical protein BESB_009480 [Besnoitia besnoiti]|uniref:Uncharacterized protein n=1 Tax=Besnoitia besnoiti TaxID=94643 RepID=A0A2A9MQ62_BESBE|nr:hypothetical protein BESB_009480 [Besnoitia besnoiti]PFH38606.1 hypothetical protein BESB_009480 [Besnoitia besnoiti]
MVSLASNADVSVPSPGPVPEDDGEGVPLESVRSMASSFSAPTTSHGLLRRTESQAAAGERQTGDHQGARQLRASAAPLPLVAVRNSSAGTLDGWTKPPLRLPSAVERLRSRNQEAEKGERQVSASSLYCWGSSSLSTRARSGQGLPGHVFTSGARASSALEHRRLLSWRTQTPRLSSTYGSAVLDVGAPASAFRHAGNPARNLAASSSSFSSISTPGNGAAASRPEPAESRFAGAAEPAAPDQAHSVTMPLSEKDRSSTYFSRRGRMLTACMTEFDEDDTPHRASVKRGIRRRVPSRTRGSAHDSIALDRDDRSVFVDYRCVGTGGVGPVFDGCATHRDKRGTYPRRCGICAPVCCERYCRVTTFVDQWLQESRYGLYPIWTLRVTTWVCLVGTLLFMMLGAWLISEDNRHVECRLNYEDETLQEGGSRYSLLSITADMCGPRNNELKELAGPYVYVYVEMENFYQNDAQVIWSRHEEQLAGKIFTDPKDLRSCEPVVTAVVNNVPKVLHPCGALAWNVFTDRFQFLDAVPDDTADSGPVKPLIVEETQAMLLNSLEWRPWFKNPAPEERAKYRDKVYFWMSQVDNDDGQDMYKSREEAKAELLMDRLNYEEAGEMVENGHFVQWMRPATFGSWRKLYGRIKGPVELPLFAYIAVTYDVKLWRGKKAIVLVQPSRFGGRTQFIGIAYLVFGCILSVFAVYMVWKRFFGRDGGASDFGKDVRWRTTRRSKKKLK